MTSGRVDVALALAAACLLVVGRGFVFVAFEHAHFDSDQAIVGLMAKHLAEGRAFPLFFYGQTYMLGVEAWLAVPWYWAFGPTVTALKLSLLTSNLVLAVLLVLGLHKALGLRPFLALVPAVFFLFAPPLVSARLMEAQGGNVEPLLFAVVLWWLRRRPLWFGGVLGLAFLNREFVIYVVPVLLTFDLFGSRDSWRVLVRRWLLVLVAFLVIWDGVRVLTPVADIMGPGTRGTWLGTESQLANLAERTDLAPADWPGRLAAAVRGPLPTLIGARRLDDPLAPQGQDWLAWLLGMALVAVVVRLAVLVARRDGRPIRPFGFEAYLTGVGLVAVAAFVATRPIDNAPLRYVLMALFLPIGLTALWLRAERSRLARTAGIAVLAVWMVTTAVDHGRQAGRYLSGREADPMAPVADALVARGVAVAEAGYWRAYKLTFLTGERTVVASSDVVRISAYQDAAARSDAPVRRVQESPCPGGEAVGGWYLCPPE